MPLFWTALKNTALLRAWWAARCPPRSPSPPRCWCISKLTRFKPFFRSAFFAPWVTTLVAVALVWRYIYHPQYGLLNAALGLARASARSTGWAIPRWAMPAIILLSVWKNFGYNMLVFLAGLQSIPEELYEAAALDGAGAWRRFRHITLPMLGPTFVFVGVVTMIASFQIFSEPYVMTQGGPLKSTTTLVLLMYEQGFRWWRLGLSAAIAVVLFLLTLGGTLLLQLRRSEREDEAQLERSLGFNAPAAGRGDPRRGAAALDGLGLLHARRAKPTPRRRRCCPSDPTLEHYRALFTSLNLGRYFLNSLVIARGRHHPGACSSPAWPAMPLPSCASAAETGSSRSLLAGHGHSGPGGDAPDVHPAPRDGADQHPASAPWCRCWRRSTASSWCASTRCPFPTICSTRRDSMARASSGSSARWSFPPSRPVLATLGVFTFLSAWNDFMWPLIVLSDDSRYTLPVALANLAGEHVQDVELMMGGAVVTVLPVFLAFLFLQRHYIQGIMAGSVKG